MKRHHNILKRLIGKTNYRQVMVEVENIQFAAKATKWVEFPAPEEGTPIAVVGWYLEGGWAYVYSMSLLENGKASFAFCSRKDAAMTIKARAYYLVVD